MATSTPILLHPACEGPKELAPEPKGFPDLLPETCIGYIIGAEDCAPESFNAANIQRMGVNTSEYEDEEERKMAVCGKLWEAQYEWNHEEMWKEMPHRKWGAPKRYCKTSASRN